MPSEEWEQYLHESGEWRKIEAISPHSIEMKIYEAKKGPVRHLTDVHLRDETIHMKNVESCTLKGEGYCVLIGMRSGEWYEVWTATNQPKQIADAHYEQITNYVALSHQQRESRRTLWIGICGTAATGIGITAVNALMTWSNSCG